MFIYSLIALAIGAIMWHFKLWHAGDAKLFAVFVFLCPISIYQNTTTQLPFLEIGFNTLIPICFYLLFILLKNSTTKKKLTALKETLNPKNLGTAIIVIFSISWFNIYIFQWTKIEPNIITNILLIILILNILKLIFEEQTIYLLILISIIRVFLNTDYFTTKTFIFSFVILICIYLVILGFLKRLAEDFSKRVNINKLKKGMVLAEGILKGGIKAPIKKIKNAQYIVTKDTPLSQQDINKIKTWHGNGRLHFNTIKINKTIPLAPSLFAGVLMTIISSGNFLMFLAKLFLSW